MDPLAVLENRINQLEAKLGLVANSPEEGHQGDSATANLLNTAQAISNATAGHEKLQEAMPIANELNNYTDPNLAENLQQNNIHMQEVAAAEPVLRHHCHCIHRCKQTAPVFESEPIQKAAQMQETVSAMHSEAAEIKAESDAVANGVQQLAETCGTAAANASEELANIAQKVEQVEEKVSFKRRNGLD